jgi:hypothetical protein
MGESGGVSGLNQQRHTKKKHQCNPNKAWSPPSPPIIPNTPTTTTPHAPDVLLGQHHRRLAQRRHGAVVG